MITYLRGREKTRELSNSSIKQLIKRNLEFVMLLYKNAVPPQIVTEIMLRRCDKFNRYYKISSPYNKANESIGYQKSIFDFNELNSVLQVIDIYQKNTAKGKENIFNSRFDRLHIPKNLINPI